MVAPVQGGERASSGGLDRYWTSRPVAKHVMEWALPLLPPDIALVEPSAGDGSFLDAPGNWQRAFDISPCDPRIARSDWFHTNKFDVPAAPWACVGNPPFGSASNLAIRFMKHAVELGASYVGFILPPPWYRAPAQNRAPKNLHLIGSLPLPATGYVLPDGKTVSHDRIFLLWEVRPVLRPKLTTPEAGVGWSPIRLASSTHCLRVAGGNAGAWLPLDGEHNPAAVRYLSVPFQFDEKEASRLMAEAAAHSTVQTYITKHEAIVALLSTRSIK